MHLFYWSGTTMAKAIWEQDAVFTHNLEAFTALFQGVFSRMTCTLSIHKPPLLSKTGSIICCRLCTPPPLRILAFGSGWNEAALIMAHQWPKNYWQSAFLSLAFCHGATDHISKKYNKTPRRSFSKQQQVKGFAGGSRTSPLLPCLLRDLLSRAHFAVLAKNCWILKPLEKDHPSN